MTRRRAKVISLAGLILIAVCAVGVHRWIRHKTGYAILDELGIKVVRVGQAGPYTVEKFVREAPPENGLVEPQDARGYVIRRRGKALLWETLDGDWETRTNIQYFDTLGRPWLEASVSNEAGGV